MLEGQLTRYRTDRPKLQFFEHPASHQHSRFVVYVGGLTDGLLATPYVEALAAECDRQGWAFVQPVLSSSYQGFGRSSLAQDATELSELLAFLILQEEATVHKLTAIAIIGFSTGSQGAVTLLATAPPALRALIRVVVLQAPVSDREAVGLNGETVAEAAARATMLKRASALVEAGNGHVFLDELMYGFVPITAERYVSFHARGGPDDLFSSDFSDDELEDRLGHLSTSGQRHSLGLSQEKVPDHPGLRVLFVHGLDDEYVPPTVDVRDLSARFTAAAGGSDYDDLPNARALLIEGANHNLASPAEASQIFVEAVGQLLTEDGYYSRAKGCDSMLCLVRWQRKWLSWLHQKAVLTRPVNPIKGTLFRYVSGVVSQPELQAVESPIGHEHTRFLVFIGGLTNGLLATKYIEALGVVADTRGWALVQPILSSSYLGFGMSTLAQDAAEVELLLRYLRDHRGASAFALAGFSTGCQVVATTLSVASTEIRSLVRAAVMHAPVSDREASANGDRAEQAASLEEANMWIQKGEPRHLMSTPMFGAVPITAERWRSLHASGGDDDFFSSDLSDEELQGRLAQLSTLGQIEAHGLATQPVPNHPGLRVLFAHALDDEYVPPAVNVEALAGRFVAAVDGGECVHSLLVPNATHSMSEPAAAEHFLEAVGRLLNFDPNRDECALVEPSKALSASACERRRLEISSAGCPSGRCDLENSWYAEWHARLDCWYLGLPTPMQSQLGNCIGALALHLGSRFAAVVRSVPTLAGRPTVRLAGRPTAHISSEQPTAEHGCEWLGSSEGIDLPAFPEVGGIEFSLPSIPRLVPSWQRLQGLTGNGAQRVVAMEAHGAGSLQPSLEQQRVSNQDTMGTFASSFGSGVGVAFSVALLYRVVCRHSPIGRFEARRSSSRGNAARHFYSK